MDRTNCYGCDQDFTGVPSENPIPEGQEATRCEICGQGIVDGPQIEHISETITVHRDCYNAAYDAAVALN